MIDAQLFFLSDEYFRDFPDDKLMTNKDIINGVPHSRPCFFAFADTKVPEIYWLVPISSRCGKYKQIAWKKEEKYGNCNTIRFGTVLGRETAFLIQNMCPATEEYLSAYIDKTGCPIRIDNRLAADVTQNAQMVLAKARRGARVIFPDVFKIYESLKKGKADEEEQNCKDNVRLRPVSLVGAGPGDAGLLTRKGLACIRTADVIVYDNLISGSLLNEARLDAELIYVGKRLGAHSMTQDQINQILIEQARSGKYVVRLKGGDPFVFGRGGEEAAALCSHGLSYEIVPGVSSAYSVPAYAGIPVTDRSCASSFHVITGHEGVGKKESVVDYQALAKVEGTLVFLMGLSRLEEISQSLTRYGKCPETPAAVIERGSTAGQREIVSDLAHIAEKSRVEEMKTPAVIVVGEVAALSEKLSWYGRRPLGGKRVLVTGTRHFSQEMERVLRPLGAETVSISVIESRPVFSEEMEQAVRNLSQYTWAVFTSGNGVEIFFEQMRRQRVDRRNMAHLRFATIGKKTAEALERHGYLCDFTPECYTSEKLAKGWIPTLHSSDRVLLLRARESSPVLPEKLSEAGIPYENVAVYETWTDIRRGEELNRIIKEVDYVTVASSSVVRALRSLVQEPPEKKVKVISIGPVTTKAAQAGGLPVYATAKEYTAEGIVEMILADVRGETANES